MYKMSRCAFVLVFVILFSFPAFVYAQEEAKAENDSPEISDTEVTGSQWLFIIGIDTYAEWPALTTAVNDAKMLRDVLTKRYFFDLKYLVELYNEEATHSNIFNMLDYLAENVKENDSLLIFYAGHGYVDPISKEGSWVPVEGSTDDSGAWISNYEINNYLSTDKIKAKHILVISDSSFKGDFFTDIWTEMSKETEKVIGDVYRKTSRHAITSGSSAPVADSSFSENSIFSHFLIRAFKNNSDPYLLASSIFPDVKAGVVKNTQKFPQFGLLEGTGAINGGEMVFFLKSESENKPSYIDSKDEKFDETNKLIRNMEDELFMLDEKIKKMKDSLVESGKSADNSLDKILAMIREKEEKKKALDALARMREEEKEKRIKEIETLRKMKEAKFNFMLNKEIGKYNEIVKSEFGKDLVSIAWKSLLDKLPSHWTEGVKEGDTYSLLLPPEDRILTFKKTSGGVNVDWGYSVIETKNGDFVLLGSTTIETRKADMYLIKTDSEGNKIFSKTYGGKNDDWGRCVIETKDGGYLLFGSTNSFGAGEKDFFLVKTDTRGDKIWSKTYGGKSDDWGSCVIETKDGGYLLLGCGGAGGKDVYLIKTDNKGNKLFRKIYGGDNWDEGRSVIETSDGGYLLLGETSSFGAGGKDMYLIKTDRKGNEVWAKTYGGSEEDEGHSVIETRDGGYLLIGYSSNLSQGGEDDVYLVKTDIKGNKIWEKAFGGSNNDYGRSVIETKDGDFLLLGETYSFGARGKDVYLVKTDSEGNEIWQKAYGGNSNDNGRSVIETSDGGYLLLGVTYSFGAGKADLFLIKTDRKGNVRDGTGGEGVTEIGLRSRR